MDINNNQQINTFLKGMNTDVSDALIDSSQYRYAENLRLITNTDSNEGELRIVEGTGTPYSGPWDTIIAMTSIRKYVIVVANTTYEEDDVEKSGISIFRNEKKGTSSLSDWTCIINNVPKEEFLLKKESEAHLSLVTRWESEKNIKLYIADGVNTIICINIMDETIVKSPHNTIKDISAYTKTFLKMPNVEIIPGGKLKSAKVQYAYRLYNQGMPVTTLSPLSESVPVYKTENTGYASEEVSNKAARITIDSFDGEFKKMLIFRINYVVLGQAPTVDMIYDGAITNSIVDYGNSIHSIGVSELLSYINMPIVPKVIESKADYMLAGNIKYVLDDFDRLIYEAFDKNDTPFRAYSSGDYDGSVVRKFNKQFEYDNYESYNYDFWRMDPNSAIYTLGGVGDYIAWRYAVKKYYVDKHNTAYDENDDIILDPTISLLRGEVYRYGIVLYNKDGIKSSVKWIADIKIPEGNSEDFDPGHRNFALIHPDLPKYNSSKNKWEFVAFGITFEVNVPAIKQKIGDFSGFEIVRCKRLYQDSYTITQGIIGSPQRLLRAEPLTSEDYQDDNIIYPNGFMTLLDLGEDSSSDHQGTCRTQTDRTHVMFASPEYVYQPDDIQDVLNAEKSTLYLDHVLSYKMPMDYGLIVTFENSATGSHESTINKFKTVSDINNKYARFITVQGSPSINDQNGLKAGYFALNDIGFLDSRSNDIHETCITNVAAIDKINLSIDKIDVDKAYFPEVPSANRFFDDKLAIWKDNLTPAGNDSYLGWSCGIDLYRDDEYLYSKWIEKTTTDALDYVDAPISSTGKCIILHTKEEYLDFTSGSDAIAPITIANIKKYATPYNGADSYKTNSPDYFSYGNYELATGTDWMSKTVFDGDCYLGMFTYHAAHTFNNSVLQGVSKLLTVYYVPVESTIDLKATFGELYTRVESRPKSYYVQDVAGSVDGFIQNKDAYMYNTAYNAEPDTVSFSSIDMETKIDNNDFDCRVHHSELKTNNESIDSWTIFKPLNYIDVDSRFGEITNMRLFKDKFIYWLNNAAGLLSINERTVLNDQDNNEIVLGSGGTLQRFDYISTLYGMKKNQYEAEVQSNTTLYWWDGHNKEIVGYSGGLLTVPMTKVKGVRNYINEHDELNKPTLIYNPQYDEIICSVVGDKSLVYNEKVQFFTALYTMMPLYRTIVDDTTIISSDDVIYHMDSQNDNITLLYKKAVPLLRYVVNDKNTFVKVFDISTFGGRFYGGDEGINNLTFTFKTPLKQESTGTGNSLITNREYDFRLDIPRNANSSYGDRMRGKTMQCELKSSSNSSDFSLQYIITKYRMSWS